MSGICIVYWLSYVLGDINGHIGRHADGFDGINGEYDLGKRNLEGRILLEFCMEKELCVKYMVQERGKEEDDIQNGRKWDLRKNFKKLTLCW